MVFLEILKLSFFGESFTVDVQLQNFGMVGVGELVMQVSTGNPNVNITSESLALMD